MRGARFARISYAASVLRYARSHGVDHDRRAHEAVLPTAGGHQRVHRLESRCHAVSPRAALRNAVPVRRPAPTRRRYGCGVELHAFADEPGVFDHLHAGARRRWKGGLRLQARYSLAKSIDETSAVVQADYLNRDRLPTIFNYRQNRDLSDYNIRNMLTGNLSRALPAVGRGVAGRRTTRASRGRTCFSAIRRSTSIPWRSRCPRRGASPKPAPRRGRCSWRCTGRSDAGGYSDVPTRPAANRRASIRASLRSMPGASSGMCGMTTRYSGMAQTSSSAVIQPMGSKRVSLTGRE